MQQKSKVFVGLDTSKLKISVAVAEDGRQGEIRFLSEIDNTPEAVRRLVHKLANRHGELLFCYEAGPTGYGISAPFRQALSALALLWAVGIPRIQKVYTADVQMITPPPSRGRPRKTLVPDQEANPRDAH